MILILTPTGNSALGPRFSRVLEDQGPYFSVEGFDLLRGRHNTDNSDIEKSHPRARSFSAGVSSEVMVEAGPKGVASLFAG